MIVFYMVFYGIHRVFCKVYIGGTLEGIPSAILICNCVFNSVYIRYIMGRKAMEWRGGRIGRGEA